MFIRASLNKRREENQLDATEWFIALVICSTCFGHLYAHHQELETILVLLPHMVCNALVTGGRRSGAGQQAMRPDCGNNTSVVSSSWWWAYKCPKHVKQVTNAINHLVASSWFSSLRLWNNLFYLETLMDTGVLYWNFPDRGIAGNETVDGDGILGWHVTRAD